ncbi:MAG: outer membrane protein OmpA-like peptidoglycan-associated protein [Myxococcota bacterium]|jgi:outer membrane protein OmpA-like peptidoglycan-associated protein
MLTSLLLTSLASAQQVTDGDVPALNSQLFQPTIDGNRSLWLNDSAVGDPGSWSTRFLLQWLNDPLLYIKDGEPTPLVDDVFQLDLMGGYVIGPVRAGLDVPLYLRSVNDVAGETGLGDIALDLKGGILDRTEKPVGLALDARIAVPTATVDTALGTDGLNWEIEGIADKEFGEALVAINLGTRGLPEVELENVTLNDQLFYGIMGAYNLSDTSGLSLELVGHGSYGAFDNAAANPVEAILGGWYRLSESNLLLRGGVGTGLNSAIGAPTSRVLFALAYEPPERDPDGDGILGRQDACPDIPEDIDTYEDTDGCPEPTMVTVRFVDMEQGLVTGVLSEVNGEGGGAAFTVGLEAGTWPVSATAEGYNEVLTDIDVPQGPPVERVIVMEESIKPGRLVISIKDAEGNALTGTVLINGAEYEINGTMTTDHLPGTVVVTGVVDDYIRKAEEAIVEQQATTRVNLVLEKRLAEVTAERIDIRDSVYFETNKAVIKSESFPLLNQVATILKEHEEILLLRVEGHTDSRGSNSSNLSLSRRRAASVRTYLIEQGVAADRLTSEGYGENKPIAEGNNEDAWGKNRRVDFFIAKRSDG